MVQIVYGLNDWLWHARNTGLKTLWSVYNVNLTSLQNIDADIYGVCNHNIAYRNRKRMSLSLLKKMSRIWRNSLNHKRLYEIIHNSNIHLLWNSCSLERFLLLSKFFFFTKNGDALTSKWPCVILLTYFYTDKLYFRESLHFRRFWRVKEYEGIRLTARDFVRGLKK